MARTRKASPATPSLFPGAEPERAPPAEIPRGQTLVEVAIDRPVRCQFTYGVGEGLAAQAVAGARVAVPFGALREVGVVVGPGERSQLEGRRLREVLAVLDREPLVDQEILALTRWMAEEYACSWGEALHAVLPAGLKRERAGARVVLARASSGVGAAELAQLEGAHEKQLRLLRTLLEVGGPIELRDVLRQLNLSQAPARSLARRGWIVIERVPAARDSLQSAPARPDESRPRPERLLPDQERAVAQLLSALERGEGASFLLEGVTGSGKTEVYLAAIERALALGRGAIVLVPEIALTPQTVSWFRSRFAGVAVLHSRMSAAQRLATWLAVKHGEARVVIGARSALFAPIRDLGVIVVDEEHEPSFKQDSTPRYHAREVALQRARMARAVCILGSATPSLESWQRARAGQHGWLHLPGRVTGNALPPVEVLDLRLERRAGGGSGLFTERLALLLSETLLRGEQAILFQNRRGFAPVLWCKACKSTLRCSSCDLALTWHRRIQRLVCHGCCEERVLPKACPTCTAPDLRPLGAGSERIEREISALFPRARVRRMDSDTMRRREDYERTLSAFGRGEVDVLVGTQMIAKGLDFPRVTLVGIVDADGALHLPEFRASERTFQLIAQVAGRAGRGALAGRIVVQTHAPDHPAIQRAAQHDFRGFAELESGLRAELGYPPHGRLLRVLFEDRDEARADEAARACAAHLASALAPGEVAVLGPAPAPIAMLRGRHRRHLVIKCPPDGQALSLARSALLESATGSGRARMTIDVDPQSLL